jgi:hypothetical protein
MLFSVVMKVGIGLFSFFKMFQGQPKSKKATQIFRLYSANL